MKEQGAEQLAAAARIVTKHRAARFVAERRAARFVAERRAGRFATDHGAAGTRSVRPKVVPA